MHPRPRLVECFGPVVEPLGDEAAGGRDFLEPPLRDDVGNLLLHRLQDTSEVARVDEAEAALTRTDGEIVAERVRVEEESAASQRLVNLT
jgi:hypothetical protein